MKDCPEGKVRNPKTNRCIKIKEIKKKECPEGKILNPLTNQCIKIKEIKPKKISKSISTKTDLDIDIDKKAIIIQRNFKKFIYPFVNRVSANIYDRKNYYNLVLKFINFHTKKNNYCIRFYKFDENGEPIFRIGDKLILKKMISNSKNKNAVVYLSGFRDKNKKIFKFAVKINAYSKKKKTTKEAITLSYLTKAVLKDKCPHFPILYGILTCDDFMNFNESSFLTSKSNSQNSLKKISPVDLNIYPEFIQKYKDKNMLIYLVELANGDLEHFANSNYMNNDIMKNTLAQIYFSLIFFHREMKMIHNDAHWGNFLYHKIKPGGYFHYKIFNQDYYIENLGYLWVIYDFDFNKYLIYTRDFRKDFNRIIRSFISENNTSHITGWLKHSYNKDFSKQIKMIYNHLFKYSSDTSYTPTKMNNFIKRLLFIFSKYDFIKTNETMKETDIIINKIPYYINLYK
jgi:hypothetical protein